MLSENDSSGEMSDYIIDREKDEAKAAKARRSKGLSFIAVAQLVWLQSR